MTDSRKPPEGKTCIFLDDERFPETDEWEVVRDMVTFIEAVERASSIEAISFDHDLGHGEPTGYDTVKWMVGDAQENPGRYQGIREIAFHSANIIGVPNMLGYLRSAIRAGVFPEVALVERSVLNHPIKNSIRA